MPVVKNQKFITASKRRKHTSCISIITDNHKDSIRQTQAMYFLDVHDLDLS